MRDRDIARMIERGEVVMPLSEVQMRAIMEDCSKPIPPLAYVNVVNFQAHLVVMVPRHAGSRVWLEHHVIREAPQDLVLDAVRRNGIGLGQSGWHALTPELAEWLRGWAKNYAREV